MKRYGKALTVAIVCLLALSLTACGGGKGSTKEQQESLNVDSRQVVGDKTDKTDSSAGEKVSEQGTANDQAGFEADDSGEKLVDIDGLVFEEFTDEKTGQSGYAIVDQKRFEDATKLIVPKEYNGKPLICVQGLKGYSTGIQALETIVLPDGLLQLENHAFEGQHALKNVNIPNTVWKIGWDSFCACSSLEKIDIPDSVEVIGEAAFSTTGLKSVIIPDSVTMIERNAFYNCTKLEYVKMSENVTVLEDGVFQASDELKTIDLPAGITEIKGGALKCEGLKTINYAGTKDQWYSIIFETDYGWRDDDASFQVVCSDGVIDYPAE